MDNMLKASDNVNKLFRFLFFFFGFFPFFLYFNVNLIFILIKKNKKREIFYFFILVHMDKLLKLEKINIAVQLFLLILI